MEHLALSTLWEGLGVVLSGLVLFAGSMWLLLSAIFGVRMGYLVTATGIFAFMILLSAIWTFGAPGTLAHLGPKGQLPHWVGIAEGADLRSADFPVIEQYPGGPWQSAGDNEALAQEVEEVTTSFQGFLAEEATAEIDDPGVEIDPTVFEVRDVRFTTANDTQIAAARAFATTGGPDVLVLGFKDLGNEPLPSWLFLGGSILGFALHLPFLDRAERRRKAVLTGGDQTPWRGPA